MAQEVAPFLSAVEANDLEAVKRLLQADPQLARAAAPDGATALHTAADLGHVFALHQLVEANADPNAADGAGATPLMRAAGKARREAIEALLDLHADVNASTATGATALHHAARSKSPAVVELLLQRQAQPSSAPCPDGTALHWAVEAGELGPAFLLLEASKALQDAADSAGRTPLHATISSGHADLTLFLLERGANPNAQTEDGSTPLHIAVKDDKLEALKHLLTFGAQLLPDRSGATPLQLAEQQGRRDALRELQKKQTGGYDLPEEKRVQSMEKFKAQGNKVFEAGECSKSAKFYTLAISFQPQNHVLFSNRSASYYNLRRLYHALADAARCVELKPDWPKGYYRKGATLLLLEKFAEAKAVLEEGLRLDPKNNDLRNAMKQLEKAQGKSAK